MKKTLQTITAILVIAAIVTACTKNEDTAFYGAQIPSMPSGS